MRENLRPRARMLIGIGLIVIGLALRSISGDVAYATGGLVWLGVGLLVPWALIFGSGEVLRPREWGTQFRFPKRPGPRAGATLVTAAVAMMLVAMCLTAVMQAYVQGGRAREVQARRVAATAACREAIEGARARGYGGLGAEGEYSFDVRARRTMRGVLQVAAGPVPQSKLVTATVTWAGDDLAPGGSATLTTILSARGIGG